MTNWAARCSPRWSKTQVGESVATVRLLALAKHGTPRPRRQRRKSKAGWGTWSSRGRLPMGHPVAVISHSFWSRYLSGDPHPLNTTIRVNGYPFTVVGVAPPGFFGVEVGASPQIWIPLMMQPASQEDGRNLLSNFDYPFEHSGTACAGSDSRAGSVGH